MKSFLYIHITETSAVLHTFSTISFWMQQWRDQPNSVWVWDGIVGYIKNTCIINVMPRFCSPLFVVLQTLRLTMLNLTLSGLMVWKKIIVFIQQSCACVLCQMLVCPFDSKSYKFFIFVIQSKCFLNLWICSKVKMGRILLFISFFKLGLVCPRASVGGPPPTLL